jgi:hypothetical protein
MSTSPRADGGNAPTTEPHEEVAAHVGAEFAETIDSIRAVMHGDVGMSYLAHYSSGVFDYGIDLLGDPPIHAEALPGSSRREELQRLGRSLHFTMSDLDRTLQEARTGGLIRTVLHAQRGAAFCCSVVPREDVVGILLDEAGPLEGHSSPLPAATVTDADRAVSRLASDLRRRIRLPSTNPGGWETADQVAVTAGDGPVMSPFVAEFDDVYAGDLLAACRQAVRPADLHLVAYCRTGQLVFTADCLDDRALAPFFTQITVGARRRFYQRISRDVCTLVSRFGKAASSVLGGRLLRMVLDVEQGAIYYYRVHAGDYLVGVTIDQDRVSVADDKMSQLAVIARHILTT